MEGGSETNQTSDSSDKYQRTDEDGLGDSMMEDDASKSQSEITGDDDRNFENEAEDNKTIGDKEFDSFEDEYSDEDEEDEELDESEIDTLLEEALPQKKQQDNKNEDGDQTSSAKSEQNNDGGNELIIKKIVILEEKGGNTFEVLPGGWIQVRHSSGMPLYLHRKTRVCTVSKPYYLGPASVRRHSIPLSGIPCLAYRRALEKEEKDKEQLEKQVEELENQDDVEQHSPEDNPESVNVLTKCLNANNIKERSKKCPVVNTETIAEKMKALKRKLEAEKEATKIKQAKHDGEEPGPQEGEQTDASSTPTTTGNDAALAAGDTGDAATTNNNEGDAAKPECPKDKNGKPNKRSPNKRGDKSSPGARNIIPLAKVETARENASLYSVSPMDLREYCRPLFKFTEVECKRFKTWSARRRHTKEQKRKQLERPTLPENAQVIKFFDLSACKGGEEQIKKFNDYVFNPNGKSSVCILHEFVQHALRKQPTYSFQELENAATPYSATVMINDIPYGRGYGSSKKTAKAEAAKATLEILIPQMKGQLNGNKTDPGNDFDITEYFQQVDMNDPRISKMCTSVSEPSPYTLLLTCLQRSFGKNDSSQVVFEMLPADLTKGNPPNQFKMTAGDHSVVVSASNKREGKQLASQKLLCKIHPHVINFGAFIKMYGNGSIKSVKEKKQEEQQITTLQSKASANSPNWAILNKLREEMMKLAQDREQSKADIQSLSKANHNAGKGGSSKEIIECFEDAC